MAITVADLLVRFAVDTDTASAGFDQMDRRVDQFADKSNTAFSSLQNIGTAAIGAAGAGLLSLGGAMAATAVSGTQMAADLESQISGIAAVLGESSASVQPLKDAILGLGLNPNLKVSTLEAAAAMEALATNGLTMTQIIDGAAEATVLLSNATGGDFAQSADIMTDAMNLFGQSAGTYQDAVDGVVSVTNASKFTVNDYALALAQAGGVASSVGVEFNDFNTSIAAISSLFASGSDAGTSYKSMLSRLIPSSKEASAEMAKLGIITADGSNQFFDAQGNLKGMADIAGILQGALSGLSEEQKNQALATIFGADAMRAAVGLAKVGKQGFEELQATMGNTDALESAATRMDNARGAMEILGGVVETVKIQIGDAFLPVMRQLATQMASFVTANSGRITMFFETMAIMIGSVASHIPALVDALFGLFSVFSAVTTAIQQFITDGELLSTTNFGLEGSVASLANNIVSFILTVYESAAAIMDLIAPIVTTITQFVSWQDVMIALGVAVASVVIPAIASFVVALAPVIATIAAVVGAVAVLRNAWESNFLGIQQIVEGVQNVFIGLWDIIRFGESPMMDFATWFDVLQPLLGTTVTNAVMAFGEALYSLREIIVSVGSTLVGVFAPIIARIGAAFGDMIASLGDLRPALDALLSAFAGLWSAVQPIISQLAQAIGVTLVAAAIVAGNLVASAFSVMADLVGNAITTMTGVIEGITAIVSGVVQLVTALINGDWAGAWQGAQSIVGGVVTAVEALLTGMLTQTTLIWAAISNAVSNSLSDMGLDVAGTSTAIQSTWSSMWESMRSASETAAGAVAAALTTASSNVSLSIGVISSLLQGDWAGAWNGASQLVQSNVDSMTNVLAAFGIDADAIFATVRTWLDTNFPDAMSVFKTAWDLLWAAARVTFDTVWAVLQANWTTVKAWLDTTLPTALTALGTIWQLTWTNAQALWITVWSAIESTWTVVATWLNATLPTALTALSTAWSTSWNAINTTLTTIWSGIRSLWTIMQTWLTTTLPTALTAMKDDAQKQWESIKATISDKIGLILGTFNNVKTWLDSTLRTAFDAFKTFLSGLSFPNPFAGLSGAISGITGAISDAQSSILSYIDWLSNLSIPNPLAGVFGGGGEEEGTGGGADGGGGGGGGGGRGRGLSLVGLAPVGALAQSGGGLNVDTLAQAIVQALQDSPLAVSLRVEATINGERATVDRLSYEEIRRVSDVIQRRVA